MSGIGFLHGIEKECFLYLLQSDFYTYDFQLQLQSPVALPFALFLFNEVRQFGQCHFIVNTCQIFQERVCQQNDRLICPTFANTVFPSFKNRLVQCKIASPTEVYA